MADSFDENGLIVKTLNEIISDLESGFQTIYGADINIDQNSPDGQLINILAQSMSDIRELAVQINNGFNPDLAVGSILDQRCAINNVTRLGGSFTIVPIDVTTDRTVTLTGLDSAYNDINGTGYTIQDDAGNQFILIDTVTLTAGTTTVNFRAKEIGAVETTVDTITNFVTIVLGVTAVNNPSAPLSTGVDEETDSQLRLRRQQSVANASSGYLNGLLGTVLALDGVTSAKLYENFTNSVDADGIPAHGIWLIVADGANTDIANAIYEKKSYGCDMKGDTEIDITTASGGIFTAKFDRPAAKNLYIRFDVQKTSDDYSINPATIKTYIEDNLIYGIGDYAETSSITTLAATALSTLATNVLAVNMEISSDGTNWYDYLAVDTLDEQWAVSTDRITITVL